MSDRVWCVCGNMADVFLFSLVYFVFPHIVFLYRHCKRTCSTDDLLRVSGAQWPPRTCCYGDKVWVKDAWGGCKLEVQSVLTFPLKLCWLRGAFWTTRTVSRGLLLPGAADFEFYASDKERRHSLSRYPTRRTIQRRQPLKKPRARLGKTMTKLEVSRRVLRLFTHAHCQHVRGFFWSSLFFFFLQNLLKILLLRACLLSHW